MLRPELTKLVANELRLFLEDPVSALFDDPAFRRHGDGLGGGNTMVSERRSATPGKHRNRESGLSELAGLLGHLRNVAIEVQTCAKVSGLAHLYSVRFDLLLFNGLRVIGEIAKEVPQVLLFPALY